MPGCLPRSACERSSRPSRRSSTVADVNRWPSRVLALVLGASLLWIAAPAGGEPLLAWPLHGAVIRAFEAPAGPYASGHRGIDIAAPFGTPVLAAEDGVVAFAGQVGGELYVSIDHAGGIRTTYSWLSIILVARGQVIRRGEPIAGSGQGHPGSPIPHLHFGVKIGDTYVDPLTLLEPADLTDIVHLAPIA